MNESRQQQMLAGQSSIAQKIFGYVPIQSCWSVHDIHRAVLAANASGASAYASVGRSVNSKMLGSSENR